MSEPSLNHLEREVEAARVKLAADLAVLRSPDTFSEFTDGLKSETVGVKDALVEKAKSSVQSTIEGLVEDLKGKAAANPTATLAIGAGIAWRLFRHPPIATALVGAGLVSLLRTTPWRRNGYISEDYMSHAKERLIEQSTDFAGTMKGHAVAMGETVKEKATEFAGTAQEKATELADTAKEQVQQWSAQAQSAAQNAAAAAGEQADSVLGQASQKFDEVRQSASNAAARVRSGASSMPRDWAQPVEDAFGDQEVRDKFLLGAAGLAVAAALSIAYQRRHGEHSEV
jgi:hypothetical protein